MNKQLFLLFAIFLLAFQVTAQEYLNIDEKIKQQPIILFFTADYCHYCKWMKKTTFSKKKNKQLHNQFQLIEIQESFQGEIQFKNEKFLAQHNQNHSFTKKYAQIDKTISYPTTLIINQNKEVIFKERGFINRKDFMYLVQNLQIAK